ncbi:hypothetical protein PPERSA_04187 [Pseudocohnilembus persalinus]|uniref:Attractin/MKLN-like beta-propeller domain-containing protein n=1 Tax=Pseudocohnilembus persalinus TaxID=266149 RepID=A0A0V0QMR2_PSEPJ|nr:hypothetical protein PPERSA_04187 [Pseudocohnilembus persalinus]|eukprot:KRX03635.1 hypothetical protein PPERSA_04187 [Pseudocohnilembus persalinus]
MFNSKNRNQSYSSNHSQNNNNNGQIQQSGYFVKSFCQEHPEEYLTNFCSHIQCLRPLCPDCIEQHIQFHKQTNSFPDIESIKNVKTKCEKKIRAASQDLVSQLDVLENKNLFLADDFMDEGLITLKKQREQLINMVESYFNLLEQKYRNRINEFSTRGHTMNNLLEKIRNMLNELEFLKANLESPNQINALKKICNMDLRTTLELFKREISKLDKDQNYVAVEVQINDKRLDFIQQELFKYTNLGNIKETNPNAQMLQSIDELSEQPIALNQPVVQSKVVNQQDYEKQMQYQSPQSNNISTRSNHLYNTMNLRDIDRKFENKQLYLNMKEYFAPYCNQKNLHFFQHYKNILHICNLDQLSSSTRKIAVFDQIQLSEKHPVREFHKSIITNNGEIFLCGGKISSELRSNEVFKYDYNNKQLTMLQSMQHGRSSHSIQYHQGYIYVVGGFLDNQIITGLCEKYNIDSGMWEEMAELNSPVINSTICVFQDKYLVKFGGLENKQGTIEPNNIIEIYDIQKNKWTIIDAKFSNECTEKQLMNFRLLNSSCAIQINQNEIYVFGGYLDNKESNQTFILSIDIDDQQNLDAVIKNINLIPLLYAEGFWNNTPIFYSGKIYALQNINNNQKQECVENARVILQFDGIKWSEVNLLYY